MIIDDELRDDGREPMRIDIDGVRMETENAILFYIGDPLAENVEDPNQYLQFWVPRSLLDSDSNYTRKENRFIVVPEWKADELAEEFDIEYEPHS
jgi:hypothetical protein